MKLSFEQLDRYLGAKLPRNMLIFGDEPLLLDEAADKLRCYCIDSLQCEREVHRVETGFDWQAFNFSGGSLSLFSQRRLLELKIDHPKITDNGVKALQRYFEQPDEDLYLLAVAGKLDKNVQRSKWFKLFEQNASILQVWPVDAKQLPRWIGARLAARLPLGTSNP